jgi:hypothetical protein
MELLIVNTVIMADQGGDETILNLYRTSRVGPFTAGNTCDNFSGVGWTRNVLSETFTARGCNSRVDQIRVGADAEEKRA